MSTCVKRIINPAPMVLFRYTEDLSNRVLPFERTPYPQHLPIFYVQAESGPVERTYVSPSEAIALYGIETFNLTGKYANHQTFAANICFKNANLCCIQRITDGTIANMLLSLDVAEVDDIKVWLRDVDGKLLHDANGDPIQQGTDVISGYLCKWVLSSEAGFNHADPVSSMFGKVLPSDGSLINADGSASTLYPIQHHAYNHRGTVGNLFGIRMWASDTRRDTVDMDEIIRTRSFPYNLAIIERPDKFSSPDYVESLFGESTVEFSYSTKAKNAFSGTSLHLTDVIVGRYSNTTDESRPLRYGAFENFTHVYQQNVEKVLELFMLNELAYLDSNTLARSTLPVTTATYDTFSADRHLFNFFTGSDWEGTPYHTMVVDQVSNLQNNIRLNSYTNLFCTNGEDRIMGLEDYEAAVKEYVSGYADCDNPVQDLGNNPESVLYDTGFTPETKASLLDVLAIRPDMFYGVSTHVDDADVIGYRVPTGETPRVPANDQLTLAGEFDLATGLTAQIRSRPESTYYGTPVVRCMLYGGSGKWRGSPWTRRVSMMMDFIDKASKMMGAGNYAWKADAKFSRAPGNLVLNMTDLNVPWVPKRQRINNWDVGLNLPLVYERGTYFQPGYTTSHPNDTSVLNNVFMAFAICTVNKVVHESWREYAGADDLSDGELTGLINSFITARLASVFAGMVTVVPHAYVTYNDELRGYSVTVPVDVYAGGIKTVWTVHVRAHRSSELTG